MKPSFFKSMTIEKWMMLLAAGIFLIVLSFSTTPKTKMVQSDEAQTVSNNEQENIQMSQYQKTLEKNLMETLQKVKGVGKVNVMITLKSSSEKVVNKDEQTETRTGSQDSVSSDKQTTVLTNDSQTPYIIKEIMPEIAGVIVVAEGGEDAAVKNEIYEAVQALFDISFHKIKVLKGNF